MSTIINNIDFENLPAEKFWSFPKSYKGDVKEETKNIVLSEQYICTQKQDGHYFRFIKDEDGKMRLQGRTAGVNGEYLDKLDHVPHLMSFFESLPNGTCLLGEIYFPNKRGSKNVTTVMGCLTNKAIERQEKGDKLFYYIFDVYAWAGKSLLNVAYETRMHNYLEKIEINNPYIERAIPYEGEKAWEKLEEILSSGGEGMVAVRKNAKVEPGKRTSRKTLKIKTSLSQTIDAFYDGNYKIPEMESGTEHPESWQWWYNRKTGEKTDKCKYTDYCAGETWIPIKKAAFYGWASAISFSVMKDGKPYHLGYISGIPEDVRAGVVEKPDEWIGKVAELSAMELEFNNGRYTLRHGKILQWRDANDKRPEDCTFEQIAD